MTNSLVTRRFEHSDKGVVVLHINGRLDMSTLEDFKNLFSSEFQTGNYKLVLNMAEVNFIVSTHLGVIMSNYKNAQAQEGDVKFSALTEEVFGIFDLLQLTSILNIFKTDDEAIGDFE